MFNVPQFIDIEDKIVGPLTAKQLGWVGAGGILLIILWFILDFTAFIFIAVFVGAFFGVMAFYKPNGQPMITYFLNMLYFIFRPKLYIWRRMPETNQNFETRNRKNVTMKTSGGKKMSPEKLQEISQLLDKKY